MTEFERAPDFSRGLQELARGRRQDYSNFQPSSFVPEVDGGMQQTEGSTVSGGIGSEPENITQVSSSAPPAPQNIEIVTTVGNGVIYADVTWNIDTTDPDFQSIVGWQVDWVPTLGGVTHRRTTADTALVAPDAPRTERIDPLLPSTQYTVRVRGITAVGTPGVTAETTTTTGVMVIEDAEFRNVVVRGEFDTSDSGTGDGVWVKNELTVPVIKWYRAGVLSAFFRVLSSLQIFGKNNRAQLALEQDGTIYLRSYPSDATVGSPTPDTFYQQDAINGHILSGGKVKMPGGARIGPSGSTEWLSETHYIFTWDPPSVAANTTAVLSIPNTALPGSPTIDATDVVTYHRGLQGTLLFQGVLAVAGAINLRVHNRDPAAFDQASTTFEFTIKKR